MRRFIKLTFSASHLNFVIGKSKKTGFQTICPLFVGRSLFLCCWFWNQLMIFAHSQVSICFRHESVFRSNHIILQTIFFFFYTCRLQFLIFFPSLNGLCCFFTFFLLNSIDSGSFFLFQLTFKHKQEINVFCK